MVEDMGVATGVDLEAMIAAAAEAERIVGRTLLVAGAARRAAHSHHRLIAGRRKHDSH